MNELANSERYEKGPAMTFVTRREGIVPVSNIGDYLAWSASVSEILQARPGFQGSFILNSLAHLDKYTSLTLWDSRQAWRRGHPIHGTGELPESQFYHRHVHRKRQRP